MDAGDDADKKVEADAVAFPQARAERFLADARDPDLAVGFVGEGVVNVVRQLAVDTDRLQLVKDGVAGSLQHKGNRLQ